jgi:glycosyltransferase involved in cell wall biosynthesis
MINKAVSPTKRIVILSHVNAQPLGQVRWRRFASNYPDFEVHLISPKKWTSTYLSKSVSFSQSSLSDENFHIHTLNIYNDGNDSTYLFRNLLSKLKQINPDIIYVIGVNVAMIHAFILKCCFFRQAKLIAFTMSAPIEKIKFSWKHFRHPYSFFFEWLEWYFVLNLTDAIICHYPELQKNIMRLGYKKKILVQTQIGVDEELYKFKLETRLKLRYELNLSGFVIGFAGRVNKFKGILDIARLMSNLPNNVQLLIIGEGDDRMTIEEIAYNANWRDRLKMTGYVAPSEVVNYMSTIDCLVVPSRTTNDWVDTFPNVLAQGMTLGIAVIGSNSGAIPFMIGDNDLIFEEGKIEEMSFLIEKFINDNVWMEQKSKRTNVRALEEFSTKGINNGFYQFCKFI